MIISFLNKPYPFIVSPVIRLALAFLIGLVVFLLLNTYRPFGIEQIPQSETAFIAGYGLVAMTALLISLFTFPQIIDIERWTTQSEALLHLFNWLLTSTLAYFYTTYFGADISPQHSLPKFISIVGAIYLVPLLVMVFITEKYLQHRNENQAQVINDQIDDVESDSSLEGTTIMIQPDTASSKTIALNTSDFIYAASDNNYVMLYHLNAMGDPQKQLIRLSLKKLETQVKAQTQILRCHKSYLVNRNHIQKVSGNARSLYLKVNHFDFQIPVSRSFDRSQLS